MNKKTRQHAPERRLSWGIMLFFFLAFLLLAAKNQATSGYILAVSVPCLIYLGVQLLPRLFPVDQLLLSLTNFLCALGILLQYSVNPSGASQQALSYGIGLAAMIACVFLVRGLSRWDQVLWMILPVSLLLLAAPLLLGREINGARSWLTLGSFSFQPSEAVKLSLVIFLAWLLSRRRYLLALLLTLLFLVLLLFQRDLGTALLYYCTALLLFWAASGNLPLFLLGLGGGAGAAVFGYRVFSHVRQRVAIWQNPWADPDGAGYQLIQGLNAMARGGIWGVGLGRGNPASIPVCESDFIFAVLCEQFGLFFAGCVLLIYAALILRSASVACSSLSSFHSLLAIGAAIMLGLQTFVIIGGVLGMIPLTGVTLPFISYGGSSLISSLCLTGLVQGVESINEDHMREAARMTMLDR